MIMDALLEMPVSYEAVAAHPAGMKHCDSQIKSKWTAAAGTGLHTRAEKSNY
jgi:hypothetical protein